MKISIDLYRQAMYSPLSRKMGVFNCAKSRLSLFLILLAVWFFYFLLIDIIYVEIEEPTRYNNDDVVDRISKSSSSNNKINQYPACPIPQLDPYDKTFEQLANKTAPPPVNCLANYTLLFNSTLDSKLVPVMKPDHFRRMGWISCCYRTVERDMKGPKPDNYEIRSSECYPISITNATQIPDAHEFIAIYCNHDDWLGAIPVDVHAFVPLKPKPAKYEAMSSDGKLNVLMFGMDATSRMNFLRTMPQSHAFLMNEMDAVEMTGYNKVGENTYLNLIPLLTSAKASELRCLQHYADGCPLIWRKFRGYHTSYSEDSKVNSLFNMYNSGFQFQPTDYYIRPLAHWTGIHLKSEERCYGPRLGFQFLLDYMHKFVHRMSQSGKNFFQFQFSALTHDHPRLGLLGDGPLLNSLKWLKTSDYLNNTVLILMSDHGMRVGSFRSTLQGQLEDRLPLMYFVFPEGFKSRYSRAYRNLLRNRDKLVTVFDLHQTLVDIADLGRVQESAAIHREQMLILAEQSHSLPRGISLFLPIPESRTCQMAGIEMNFCSCNYRREIDIGTGFLTAVANSAVSHVNSLLKNHTRNCAHLQLANVTLAQQVGWLENDMGFESYLVNFVTDPGGAEFEAMVERRKKGEWHVRGTIARTNVYGNQSHCVGDRVLKPYCHCLNN